MKSLSEPKMGMVNYDSPVSPVLYKPLITLASPVAAPVPRRFVGRLQLIDIVTSPVLAGPLLRNPHTPIALPGGCWGAARGLLRASAAATSDGGNSLAPGRKYDGGPIGPLERLCIALDRRVGRLLKTKACRLIQIPTIYRDTGTILPAAPSARSEPSLKQISNASARPDA